MSRFDAKLREFFDKVTATEGPTLAANPKGGEPP
jgi:hypothetical protein